MTRHKPFYRLVGRELRIDPVTNGRMTDALIFQNDHDSNDRIITTEWAYWRLWRYAT